MGVTLVRKSFRSDGVFGELLNNNGGLICFTLEHAFATPKEYLAKVPLGEYSCIRRHSPKFGYDVFLLQNVLNNGVDPADKGKKYCDYIEIHKGNYNHDSDGCILLGAKIIQTMSGYMLSQSELAFDVFMRLQNGVNEFILTVK